MDILLREINGALQVTTKKGADVTEPNNTRAEGAADGVGRRVQQWRRRAGVLAGVTALTGLPLVVWLYAWLLLDRADAPSGALGGVLIVVTVTAAIAAFACNLYATHGVVRMFDDEMRRANRSDHMEGEL